MAMRVWCRLGDGTESDELHPSEDAARASLDRTLANHRAKGHAVAKRTIENDPHAQWIAEDEEGKLVAMYQLID